MNSLLLLLGKAQAASGPYFTWDATSGLPPNTSYARADPTPCATRRANTGELAVFAANAGPLDYAIDGTPLGVLNEAQAVNRCTNYNAVISATTGWTATGTVTVSTVSDTAALTAFKVRGVVTGSVISLDGGASGGTAVIAGTVGATGACSASLVARVVTGSSASFGVTPNATFATISGSAYQRFYAENVTATATTDQMVVTVPAGVVIYVVLNQLEVGKCSTSVIVVDGVTRTRAKTFCQNTGFTTGFNLAKGAMVVSYRPLQPTGHAAAQGLAVLAPTGSFPTSAFYIQCNLSSGKPAMYGNGAGNTINAAPLEGLTARDKSAFAISWDNGVQVLGLGGPGVYKVVGMPQAAVGPFTTLTIGSFAANSGQCNGWIDKIYLFNYRPTIDEMQSYMTGTKVGGVHTGGAAWGQSNVEGLTSAATVFTNGGQRMINNYLDAYWPTSRNWFLNGSLGGTSIPTWDPDDPVHAQLTAWTNSVTAYLKSGGLIKFLLQDQGESSIGYSKDQFKAAYLRITNYMRDLIFSYTGVRPPVFICPLGRYVFPTPPAAYNDATNTNAGYLKAAHRELAAENAHIHLLPEKFIWTLVDNITHFVDGFPSDGYSAIAERNIRKVLKTLGEAVTGGVDGPTWTYASAAGNVINVNITHDIGGTDFTPTTGIQEWSVVDNGTRIKGTAARTSATSLAVTLDTTPSGPAGTRYLEYANGLLWDTDVSKLVRDNSAWTLPLRPNRVLIN